MIVKVENSIRPGWKSILKKGPFIEERSFPPAAEKRYFFFNNSALFINIGGNHR